MYDNICGEEHLECCAVFNLCGFTYDVLLDKKTAKKEFKNKFAETLIYIDREDLDPIPHVPRHRGNLHNYATIQINLTDKQKLTRNYILSLRPHIRMSYIRTQRAYAGKDANYITSFVICMKDALKWAYNQ